MRPSYDGEHPVAPAPTPIYDELYSEYRRLFRALPGDRSGEEELRFTGFASRTYESRAAHSPSGAAEQYAGLAQHQGFPGFAGQLPGAPQFVPVQQPSAAPNSPSPQPYQPQASAHPSHPSHSSPSATPSHPTAHQNHQNHQGHQTHQSHQGQQSHQNHQGQHQSPSEAQPTSGQGWVAAGYLAPAAVATPGRHRSTLLSLPPGRS
ncbi:hypothetical protein LN042_29390 [Kitasatospora sp. RB6PN24]|uniref:hypothetical protein n=1 Tax=Kitasatospora humi TaxID=2893891 RepID=UPI001E563572|nr:hypothetical protein [Kitasatospora humi]MCC9311127.1 hypothetical protein [Kitasatospora humi]